MLGDAFISNKVNSNEIDELIEQMKKNNFDYCNLYSKSKSNIMYRKIKRCEIYAVGFISFIASKKFIVNEFNELVSDFDFEEKYLINANKCIDKNLYWDNMIICTNNALNIVHGLQKGVWIRDSYSQLSKYTIIKKTKRHVMTIKEATIHSLRIKSHKILSPRMRILFKRLLSILGFKFSSKF